jgi:hypothetical protein
MSDKTRVIGTAGGALGLGAFAAIAQLPPSATPALAHSPQ